jgi:two-component system, OmpR family, response regulator
VVALKKGGHFLFLLLPFDLLALLRQDGRMSATVLIVDDNKELVTLLTTLFEEAGIQVVAANRGRAAIDAHSSTIDAALIDVLLPDMLGYEVAEAFRRHHKEFPVFFMSGVFKGLRHSKEASVKIPGSIFLEKPFDAKELLHQMLAKLGPQEKPAESDNAEEFDVELDVDIEDAEDEMELTGRVRVTGGGDISAELQGANLTAQRSVAGPVSGTRPQQTPAPSKGARAARKGELKDNLPGLITAFYLAKETGELYCQKNKVKKVVYFEQGQPVFALSNLAADRFGQFLVRVGKLNPEALQDAAVVAAESQRRLGDILVQRGLLKETERLYYIGQHVKSIIYSLFGWEEGQFVVSFREKALAETIKLDVFPANLIMRGVKKLYKPERCVRLVQPEERLIPSAQPAYQLNEIELDKWEAGLISKIDGTRNNAELVALSQKPETLVRSFLAALLGLGILEKRTD